MAFSKISKTQKYTQNPIKSHVSGPQMKQSENILQLELEDIKIYIFENVKKLTITQKI